MEREFEMKSKLLVILLIGTVAILGNYFRGRNQNSLSAVEPFAPPAQQTSITEEPYKELTIPYLRNRSFSSKINEMRQIGKNNQFTSYIASYQSDGLKINGLLLVPSINPDDNKLPAIVFIHGYIPPAQYKTEEKYVDYINYLARNGFVVFKIDLRGHGESEGEANGAYYSSDYIIDTLNAYSAMQNLEFVDSDKVGLWGHSMAGNVVLRSIAAKPDIPAAVIWAGAGFSYEDLQKYRINDGSYRPPQNNTERQSRRRQLFETHGEFSRESEFWRSVSPSDFLVDVKGAVQLHHAVNDNVVNIGYSRDLKSSLDRAGVKNELHEYQSGGHNISGSSFSTAMRRTVEFYTEQIVRK